MQSCTCVLTAALVPAAAYEAVDARERYEKSLYPRMAPHQKVMTVPGTFACSNLTYMPLEESSKIVVEKLQAYFAWMRDDPRVVGMVPWHFSSRSHAQSTGVCDMRLGAVNMPLVLAELQKIGSWIKHHNHEASIRAKTDNMY